MNKKTIKDVIYNLNDIINKNFSGVVILDEINYKTGKSYGVKESVMNILCNEIEKIINDGSFVCSIEDVKLSTPCCLEKVFNISIIKKVIKKSELMLDKTLLNKQEIIKIDFDVDSEYDQYIDLSIEDFKSTVTKILLAKKVNEMEKQISNMEIEKQRLLSLM